MEGKEQPRQYNNGRRHTPATKRHARALRRAGTSYKEIARTLGIGNGTSYLWTSDIKLSSTKLQKIEAQRIKLMATHKRPWSAAQRKAIGRRSRKYQLKHRPSKTSLIKEIRDFYKKNNRIPLKKEFNSRRSFRTRFGTWNNAIIAAGFKPNPVFFAERVIAQDGHVCDSFAEKIIDDWLSANEIQHERNIRYPASKMTCDFYIPDRKIYIEFFGLRGVNKKYDRNHNRKLELVAKNSFQLLALYTDDILKRRFEEKINRMLQAKADNFS